MMRIDSVSAQPDRAGRYRVTFSEGESLRLYKQTVQDFGLYSGLELSDEEYAKLKKAASQMSAKMRAVRIVSATSVSKQDLQQRLIQKGEDPQHAQQAVSWMEEMHLVDDRRTAEQIVERCISKGYGLARAKQALYEKRIPKEFWDAALADYPNQSDKIMEFLQSRLDGNSDQKDVKRAVDALMRRGHSYSRIRRALDRLSMDADDFPED
jgi:regulatory protein